MNFCHIPSENQRDIVSVSNKAVLLVVYGILLVELLAVFHNSSVESFTLLTACTLFLVTACKPFWGIWLFVAVLPLLNGIFVISGTGGVSVSFSAVYLAWFPRFIFRRSKSQSRTTAYFLTHLLAIILLVNLALVGIRIFESPIPSRYWFEWVSIFPFTNQSEHLWQINAALILLKGIVLFQMVEQEITGNKLWVDFSKTIYIQAIIIAGFSLFQLVSFKINGVNFLGLTLPFNDIHSYGSAVVLIFIALLMFFINSNYRYKAQKKHGDSLGRAILFKRNLLGLLIILFFILCLYSSSRMTWLVMASFLFLILLVIVKNKKIIALAIITTCVALIVGIFFAPALLQSQNKSLIRLGTILNVKDISQERSIDVRYELWQRTLKMVREYPLTGIGIGNVYRNIESYKNRSVGRADTENSHNYYLQLTAELGIPAFVIFFCIILSLYLRPTKTEAGEKHSSEEISPRPFRYGLAAYLLTMLTGHPLLLSSQQFLFWPIVALISKGEMLKRGKSGQPMLEWKVFKNLGIAALLLYLVGSSVNLYRKEPWTIPSTYGFYAAEDWNGTTMRWISGKAEYYLPADKERILLKVVALPHNSQNPDGLTLTISVNDVIVDNLHFFNGGSKKLNLRLSSVNGQDVKVTFEVNRLFSPKQIGLNQDPRWLGVAIGEIDKLPSNRTCSSCFA